MEWLTGGAVRAGMHEVVVADSTLQAVARAVAEQRPLWRVSSTVFTHVASAKVRVVLCGWEQWIRPAPPPLPPSVACPPPSPPLPSLTPLLQVLRPLGHFATPASEAAYPPVLAGSYVQSELEALKLKRSLPPGAEGRVNGQQQRPEQSECQKPVAHREVTPPAGFEADTAVEPSDKSSAAHRVCSGASPKSPKQVLLLSVADSRSSCRDQAL